MPRNQAKEIYEYIKTNPLSDAHMIAEGSGWNRYVVDVALELMEEQGLIRKVGKSQWGDDMWIAT